MRQNGQWTRGAQVPTTEPPEQYSAAAISRCCFSLVPFLAVLTSRAARFSLTRLPAAETPPFLRTKSAAFPCGLSADGCGGCVRRPSYWRKRSGSDRRWRPRRPRLSAGPPLCAHPQHHPQLTHRFGLFRSPMARFVAPLRQPSAAPVTAVGAVRRRRSLTRSSQHIEKLLRVRSACTLGRTSRSSAAAIGSATSAWAGCSRTASPAAHSADRSTQERSQCSCEHV